MIGGRSPFLIFPLPISLPPPRPPLGTTGGENVRGILSREQQGERGGGKDPGADAAVVEIGREGEGERSREEERERRRREGEK